MKVSLKTFSKNYFLYFSFVEDSKEETRSHIGPTIELAAIKPQQPVYIQQPAYIQHQQEQQNRQRFAGGGGGGGNRRRNGRGRGGNHNNDWVDLVLNMQAQWSGESLFGVSFRKCRCKISIPPSCSIAVYAEWSTFSDICKHLMHFIAKTACIQLPKNCCTIPYCYPCSHYVGMICWQLTNTWDTDEMSIMLSQWTNVTLHTVYTPCKMIAAVDDG